MENERYEEEGDEMDVISQVQSEIKENPIAIYAATHSMLSKQREHLFLASQDVLKNNNENSQLFVDAESPQLVMPPLPFQPKSQNFISARS